MPKPFTVSFFISGQSWEGEYSTRNGARAASLRAIRTGPRTSMCSAEVHTSAELERNDVGVICSPHLDCYLWADNGIDSLDADFRTLRTLAL